MWRSWIAAPNLVAMFDARPAPRRQAVALGQARWQLSRPGLAARGRGGCGHRRDAGRCRPPAGRPGPAGRREPAGMVHRRSRRSCAPAASPSRPTPPTPPTITPICWSTAAPRRDLLRTTALAKRLMPAVARRPTSASCSPWSRSRAGPVPSQHRVLGWRAALARGEQQPDAVSDHADRLGPDDVACLIYTSGTGGRPKGVMLSHGNIMANIEGSCGALEQLGARRGRGFLSFLPLSHAYEHTAGQFLPVAVGAQIYYAEGVETLIDQPAARRGRRSALRAAALRGDAPAHPRAVARQGGLTAKLFHKAVELGPQALPAAARSRCPSDCATCCSTGWCATRCAHASAGGSRRMVSGGAPLN